MSDQRAPGKLMEPAQALIASVMQLVIFLFGAFGGYLTAMAPPLGPVGGAPPGWAAGYASFAGLILFLGARATASIFGFRYRAWLAFSFLFGVVFLISGWTYQQRMSVLTYTFDADGTLIRLVIGQRPLVDAAGAPIELVEEIQDQSLVPPRSVVARLWSTQELQDSFATLTRWYMMMVLSLLASIAGFTEILLRPRARGPEATGPPEGSHEESAPQT